MQRNLSSEPKDETAVRRPKAIVPRSARSRGNKVVEFVLPGLPVSLHGKALRGVAGARQTPESRCDSRPRKGAPHNLTHTEASSSGQLRPTPVKEKSSPSHLRCQPVSKSLMRPLSHIRPVVSGHLNSLQRDNKRLLSCALLNAQLATRRDLHETASVREQRRQDGTTARLKC